LLLFRFVFGPSGQLACETVCLAITTTDGVPMNAQHDYVIRFSEDDIPPAEAFSSLALYDTESGFFIPNDRKKYSAGENGGRKLDENGGLAIEIAVEQPDGVPEENGLPFHRGDHRIDPILRLYETDPEALERWAPPKAEEIPINRNNKGWRFP
jgi:hypothetical protein